MINAYLDRNFDGWMLHRLDNCAPVKVFTTIADARAWAIENNYKIVKVYV